MTKPIDDIKKLMENARNDIAAQCTTSPRDKFDISRLSHEAATERLLTIVEKAVEMAEFYADADNLMYEEKVNGVNKLFAHEGIDDVALEFLTTLADASGEMTKDGK